ncbi:MAG: hypothetical protein K9L61_01010 [Candidatus Omnitrophica bacterium]|nr:hypothetical protein [Candidatus Omnitrophota bacterium]
MKTNIFLIILLATSAYTLPLFGRNLPVLRTSLFYWGGLVLLAVLFANLSVFFKKPIIFLLVYGVVMLGLLPSILWDIPEWDQKVMLNDFWSLLIFTTIFSYYYLQKGFEWLARISKINLILIVVTLITTNIALCFYPLLVRDSVEITARYDASRRSIFQITGAMDYGYSQAVIFLIPFLIYHIKAKSQKLFSKKVCIFMLLLVFITLVRIQFFANLVIGFFIAILSFMPPKTAKKSFALIILFFILFLIVPHSFYGQILVSIGSHFNPDSVMYSKLNDLAIFIQKSGDGPVTQVDIRMARYPLLFKAFMTHPFLGVASDGASFGIGPGRHIYFMYNLTLWGIFGFLFFIFVLYQVFKTIIFSLEEKFRFYYFLSVFGFILLGLCKHISSLEPFLMLIVIIPGLYFLSAIKESKI